jgi:hypothetical protein
VHKYSTRRRPSARYSGYIILLPVAVGLIFWFFVAPSPEFANALFWLLALGSASVLLCVLHPVLSKRAFAVVLCVVFMVTNFQFIRFAVVYRGRIRQVSVSGAHSMRTVPLIERRAASGLRVYVPEEGDQCWDSPIPCTPYFNPDLRLRIPGDLSSGFMIEKRDGSNGKDALPKVEVEEHD